MTAICCSIATSSDVIPFANSIASCLCSSVRIVGDGSFPGAINVREARIFIILVVGSVCMHSIAAGLGVDFAQPTVGMIAIPMAARVFLKEFMSVIIFVFVYVSTDYG